MSWNLEWECADLEWNISHGGRTADWLLVAVCALVLVSENRVAAIHMNSATSETWSARVPW